MVSHTIQKDEEYVTWIRLHTYILIIIDKCDFCYCIIIIIDYCFTGIDERTEPSFACDSATIEFTLSTSKVWTYKFIFDTGFSLFSVTVIGEIDSWKNHSHSIRTLFAKLISGALRAHSTQFAITSKWRTHISSHNGERSIYEMNSKLIQFAYLFQCNDLHDNIVLLNVKWHWQTQTGIPFKM